MQPRGEAARRSVYEPLQDLDLLQLGLEERGSRFLVSSTVLHSMVEAGALPHLVRLLTDCVCADLCGGYSGGGWELAAD